MKIIDLIRDEENEPDVIVSVEGRDKNDDCKAFHMPYYKGELQSVPEYLHNCEVLSTGWLMGAQCHIIEIPFLYDSEDYNPNNLTYEEKKAGITLEDKQRELKAYYEIISSKLEIEQAKITE